jgi:hypothetical protein
VAAVAERGRADLEALERLEEAEDVALLVALSDRFSFAPVLVDDSPTVQSRRSRTRVRQRRASGLRTRLRMPHLHMPRVHMPTLRRRPRVRRYAIDPTLLEGPRRVPVEVLDLTPSVAVDLRLRAHARAR